MAEEPTKEGSNSSSATAVEGKPKASQKKAPKRVPPKPLPPWKVLLHNDDINTVEYVILTVVSLTPLNEKEALQRTVEANDTGVALLLTTHRERAELYQEQFQSKSLTVTIEPAE